eukprot:3139943-Amphidinium_carterae.1
MAIALQILPVPTATEIDSKELKRERKRETQREQTVRVAYATSWPSPSINRCSSMCVEQRD